MLNSLLDVAIKCDAQDIVKYLMEDHGCIPPLEILRSRTSEYSVTTIAYSASYSRFFNVLTTTTVRGPSGSVL